MIEGMMYITGADDGLQRRPRVDRTLLAMFELVEVLPTRRLVWLDDLDRTDKLMLTEAAARARASLERFERLL
jgi:hypothetical protein